VNTSVQAISAPGLAVALVPALIVVGILYRWALGAGTALYAIARMLIQLVLIGYVLTFIFETDQPIVVAAVLAVMLIAASWIALRPVQAKRPYLYAHALLAISTGGLSTLVLVTQAVVDIIPWFMPRYVVPLAGMIIASSMNAVSLAAERFEAEFGASGSYAEARATAFQAALIPVTNSLFAVGLVALPGMMTGQIMSGISPPVAVRYQIVVMCMVFGASGISTAMYLLLARYGREPKAAFE